MSSGFAVADMTVHRIVEQEAAFLGALAVTRTRRRCAAHRISRRRRWGGSLAGAVTLSEKFQISIPKAIRTAHDWKAGQKFAFIPKGTGVMLVPVPELAGLVGIAAGADPEGYRDRTDRF